MDTAQEQTRRREVIEEDRCKDCDGVGCFLEGGEIFTCTCEKGVRRARRQTVLNWAIVAFTVGVLIMIVVMK